MSDPAATLRECVRSVLPAGAPVLLAVSGGSDSVAMLGVVAAAPEFARRAAVVHVHHGLRPSAAEDAEHVLSLCAGLRLGCRVVDASPSASDGGRGETAARRRRLAALARAARELGARWVLLAHHRDDEDETVLLRLLRGHRGARSLAGVPTLRPLAPGVSLLRPFLWGPDRPGRAELARARQQAGLRHVEDPTNRDERVPRNGVRALLQQGGPKLSSRVAAMRRAARSELRRHVRAAAAGLMSGLRPEGLGARLDRAALAVGAESPETLAEALRLLGDCLRTPRRVDVRAVVLAELRGRLGHGGGRLIVPAAPEPLELVVSRDGVHLPHDALAEQDASLSVLAALSRSPLYL